MRAAQGRQPPGSALERDALVAVHLPDQLQGQGDLDAQIGINALAAGYYPSTSRAIGVSWANAVDRTGSVLGSIVGGVLLSLGWNLATAFAAAALPAFPAALATLAKGWLSRARTPAAPAAVPAE
jgi:AAHS family 4-hydroxybenzoate transporter-like MFS transporter